ncbi:4'-phosphopantetheinyl transferase family protein [Bradyrhizobium genosp. A]|uniref:4'-phosphopantetheinyl transferase family protein n=1 Tax=Bradyrhizobium genosp. A TaxID=83626 RepID=UPI003CF1EA18
MKTNDTGEAKSRSAGMLSRDEVCVWRSGLDVSQAHLTRLYRLLSPSEQERADRFLSIADAKRSILGRGYLRLLLGPAIGVPCEELQFEHDEFGKPCLLACYRSDLKFSVSHSGDWVLIAIARGRSVGIDVERIRTDIDVTNLAKRFFSAVESEKLASLTGYALYKAFFACWTSKEAYVKAKGQGLLLALDDFEVAFLPGEAPGLLTTKPDPTEASRWKLFALDVGQDHQGALIAAGQDWHLRFGTLDHFEF